MYQTSLPSVEAQVSRYSHAIRPQDSFKSGLRSGQSPNISHDHKTPIQRTKPTRQPRLESPVQTLYHLTESIIARIDVLERHDEGHTCGERVRSDSSDSITRLAAEDGTRQLYIMLETALARVSVLEGRRDICYRNAFKLAGETECIVRGCGAKSTSCKNDIRHLTNTRTPEHDLAAFLLQQRDCLQCGRSWKSLGGLDHHERTVHHKTCSSRIDMFRPYLEQTLRKYLSVMADKLWLTTCSTYPRMPINPIVTARTGQSAAHCV